MFSVDNIRKDFPILSRKVGGVDLVYFDSAATSQKPQSVIDSIINYYSTSNANVHRGIHTLSEEATSLYEDARKKVAEFIGVSNPAEIIFTKGTTESLNRVAFTWALENLKKGDVILTTEIEHHSNLIPWQIVCERTGAVLDFVDFDVNEPITINHFKEKINKNVKLVAVTHASNVLGTIFPIKEISKLAHEVGAVVSVDGAQAVPHFKVNIQSLGCDFYAFSGHKMLAPMGIGVLWGKKELLEKIEPYEYGGGMINIVEKTTSTWAEMPEKFEAGTPNVEGAIGLATAIDYLNEMGMENVRTHELEITDYALTKLSKVEGLTILGPKPVENRSGLVSFVVEGMHSHDIASILNTKGIAVRSGQHCTMPLHTKLNVSSSIRASFYIYNTKEEVDKLVEGIEFAKTILL